MNHYHNPYRNPYPGQGMNRPGNTYENPDAEPAPENSRAEAGQEAQNPREAGQQNAGPKGQGTVPPETGQQNDARKETGWQSDPSLKNMDLKKLAFLSELVAESGNKPLDALIPFLISANKNANTMGLQFNDAETNLLLEVLKKHMNPEEQARIDMLRKMADMLGKK